MTPPRPQPRTPARSRLFARPLPRMVRVACAAPTAIVALGLSACERAPGGSAGDPPARSERPTEAFQPVVLVDAAGRTHEFHSPPSRIVSLVPSATQVLVALGQTDRLVGRTDFDTASAVARVPSVGGGLQPNLERLIVLRPELVLRFDGPSDPGTPERLDRMEIAHFAVRPDGIEDVRRIVAELGAITGRRGTADSLVAVIDSTLEAVQARVAGRPPVRAVYLMEGSPPWVAGAGTFIHELIRLAGGVNVFADLTELYGPVSPEALIARGADVYLLRRGIEVDMRLVRAGSVRELDPSVEMPGPDLGAAAWEVARALHPQAFR